LALEALYGGMRVAARRLVARGGALLRERGPLGAGLLLDQALSSGGNFLVSLLVARALGPTGFGHFALVLSFWLVAMAIGRASLVQPLIVRARAGQLEIDRAQAALVSAAFAFGLGAGAVLVLISLFPLGALRGAVLALGVALPGLLVQDTLRTWLLAVGRPWPAAFSDGTWLLASASGVLIFGDALTATASVAIWGLGGTIGLLPLLFALRVPPSSTGLRVWIRVAGPDSVRFLGAQGAAITVTQGITWAIAIVLSAAALGGFRAVQNILAPGRIVMMGVEYFFVGRLAAAEDGFRAVRSVLWLNVSIVGGWSALVLAVTYLLGFPLISVAFGESFDEYSWLLLPLALSALLAAATNAWLLLLRSRLLAGVLASLTLTTGIVRLVITLLGGWLADLPGLIFGLLTGDVLHLANVVRAAYSRARPCAGGGAARTAG
jgi:O-antigen/teichoic acid export membrane protein